jgi:biopolymer transport protein ExbD
MPLKTTADDQININLTPMLDVVFNIIIFFLVATKFVDLESSIPLDVPKAADRGTLTPAPDKQVVNVLRDGTIMLNDRPVTAVQLTAELTAARAQFAELGVIVRGDASSALQPVVTALTAVKDAGIADLSVAVRPIDPGTGPN